MVWCATCEKAASYAASSMARGLVCRRPQPQPLQPSSESVSQPAVPPEVAEHPVPLVAVNVFTTIHDLAVETTIEQLYCNTELDARTRLRPSSPPP